MTRLSLDSWNDPTTAGRGRKANQKQQAVLDVQTFLLDSPWASMRAKLFPGEPPLDDFGADGREARPTRPRRGAGR